MRRRVYVILPVVLAVVPKGPAAAAKVRPGDIIQRLGATPTPTPSDLYAALRRHQPGDKVDLRIVRDRAEETVTVTLGSRPS